MNLHDPVRGPNESRDQYRARLAASRVRLHFAILKGLGDQHKAQSSRAQLRATQNGQERARHSFGRGLVNARTRKQRDAIEAKRAA